METIIGGRPLPENHFTVAHQIAEANHRIANSLSVLVGMVRMQAAAVKKKGESCSSAEVRHLLDGIQVVHDVESLMPLIVTPERNRFTGAPPVHLSASNRTI